MLQNEQFTEESHKPTDKKFLKRRVYSSFKDNIWGADLADMQLMSKFSREIRFLLCLIYVCVVPLKDRKGGTIVDAF